MTLKGTFIISGADYSPLSIYGVGTFMAFSGNGIYRNKGHVRRFREMGQFLRVNTGLLTVRKAV